jgi:PIN domain nuclease of toxin-antitoxin system
MKTIILDACALIAYMRKEKGASIVQKYIDEDDTKVMLHVVSFYEVYYNTLRQQPSLAPLLFDFVKHMKIQIYERFEDRIIKEGTRIKMTYSMSLADSIACGFANKMKGMLLTADRHEFSELARDKKVKIKFIR